MDARVQFLLYEVVARIVAIYLCLDSGRSLKLGLAQRKMPYRRRYGVLDWLLGSDADESRLMRKDDAPIRYWLLISKESFLLAACLYVVIFGWWKPHR